MSGMNSTMDIPPVPAATSTPGGTYDRNPAPGIDKPRSAGGIPVKFFENIPGAPAPGKIDTTMESAIEMGGGPGGGGHKAGPVLNTPMKALD